MKNILIILIIILGLYPTSVIAQLSREQDARLRLNLTVEKKVLKHTRLAYTQSLRLKDNWGTFDASVQELTLTYGLTKPTDLIARYRLTYDSGKGGYWRHRYAIGAKYTLRAKPFDLSVRGLYQYDYSPYEAAAHTLRIQGRAQYDRKKHWAKPYLAAEGFVRMAPVAGLYRMRYTGGSDFRLGKHHTLSAALMVQENWMGSTLYRQFIYSLSYEIEL